MAKKDKRIKYQSEDDKPVMVSVRLPRELYDRLERYATQHQQSISELLKDGAKMCLETEADPRYRRTEETEFQIDGASVLRDIQATLEQYEARFQAIERQTIPVGNGVSDGMPYSVIHGNTATGAQGPDGRKQDTVPDIDRSKYALGDLCGQGHDYHGTGQSLRDKKGECLECKRNSTKERTQRWRAKHKAKAATT